MTTTHIVAFAAAALVLGGLNACNRSGTGHGTRPESTSRIASAEARGGDEPWQAEASGTDPGSNETGRQAAAVTTANSSIVDGIARARCVREQRCGSVGTGRNWATLDHCIGQIASDWRDELNAFDCPGGIVEAELDECMEEIRNEDCASPLDTLGRIAACRTSDICRASTR